MAGRRIVVVGAGITGLTVAHRLVVDHPHLDVTVLEASTVTGGKLRTTPLVGIGMDVDEGADAFLVRVPWPPTCVRSWASPTSWSPRQHAGPRSGWTAT